MKPSQDNYPLFEANQVLSFAHLNQGFNYLEEQERLTRANLIGIGIACGLELDLEQDADGATVRISKGCGVTSQGYLISECGELSLTGYREYTPPSDPPYPPFMKNDDPYHLWEMFPAGEPDSTPLSSPANFLSDKAALLFLELRKEGLRNCSLNNCDDRGFEITVTVRRLLIGTNDLKEIIAKANALEGGLSAGELEASLLQRLNLPDLRLPRVEVPNTAPATSQELLAAFHAVFHGEKLALNTGSALTAAYHAFKPLLEQSYPSNPFADFSSRYGALDHAPATTTQVRFLQYYYDLFDDLLRGYLELCRKGAEFLAVCCPPEFLFPRHLMLGVLFPNQVVNPGIYRHPFWGSPIAGGGERRAQELVGLFARLAEMAARFTDAPPLPPPPPVSRRPATDNAIRITPSSIGDLPLAKKAIPYYYLQNGTPPLYHLWDPEKTRLNRANQNLGYRCDSWQPAAPLFVTQPLRYDLEPYNFLRIEGHLGKNYQGVINTLLTLKSRYRLPVEMVALRTGAFDEHMPADLSRERCRFQDLEALYDTLKAQTTCFLCQELQYFYSLPFESGSRITTPVKARLPLLADCAPEFLVRPQTLGRLFEDYLSGQPGGAVPDIDPNIIINFLSSQNVGQSNLIVFYIVIYVSKLYQQFTEELGQLDFPAFRKRYRDLVLVTDAVEREREESAGNLEGSVNLLRWEELDDRLEAIIYHCRLDAFEALREEYLERVREVKQKQFLSHFLRLHPGIQHKGGVPLGGTFIVVYHQEPEPVPGPVRFRVPRSLRVSDRPESSDRSECTEIDSTALVDAFTRIGRKPDLAIDPDIRMVLGAFTGRLPELGIALPPGTGAGAIIDAAVEELSDGTVIADFFLPYLCCSDCAPVQFLLPKAPPAFTVQVGCSNANNQAEVTLTPEGGIAPYSVKVDQQEFQPLTGVLVLSAGTHALAIRDQEAAESAPQAVVIPARLVLGAPAFDCVAEGNEYLAVFRIEGGTPPYTANRGTVNGTEYTSDILPGDADIEIVITDARNCTAAQGIRHTCLTPLSFTAKVGCTSTDNVAPVEVVATGGSAPYRVHVDSMAPAPLNGPISLSVGGHSISVRDAAGMATAPQTIVVAPRLALSETDFTCEGNDNYRSFIIIEGGTPPFRANNQPVTGNLFTTGPIPSGTRFSVTVTDQNNCSAGIEVEHDCEEVCTLPCDGQSGRCAYRLWVQPPEEGALYESYRQEREVRLRFNGSEIELRTDALPILDAGQLNERFPNAMGRYLKALNELINQALMDQIGALPNRLVLSYDPEATEPFSTLSIEHFVCETFNLEFRYSFARPSPAFSMAIRYSNEPAPTGAPFDGAVFINQRLNNKETRVPAFDCAERNLCSGSDYQRLCEGAQPELELTMERFEENGFRMEGRVGNLPEHGISAWLWDFPMSHPFEPFYEGRSAEVFLERPRGLVKLTAITEKGCFGSTVREIV